MPYDSIGGPGDPLGGNVDPNETSEEAKKANEEAKKANEEAKEAKVLAKKKYKEQTKELKANQKIFEALKEYHILLAAAHNLYKQALDSKQSINNEWSHYWGPGKTTTDTQPSVPAHTWAFYQLSSPQYVGPLDGTVLEHPLLFETKKHVDWVWLLQKTRYESLDGVLYNMAYLDDAPFYVPYSDPLTELAEAMGGKDSTSTAKWLTKLDAAWAKLAKLGTNANFEDETLSTLIPTKQIHAGFHGETLSYVLKFRETLQSVWKATHPAILAWASTFSGTGITGPSAVPLLKEWPIAVDGISNQWFAKAPLEDIPELQNAWLSSNLDTSKLMGALAIIDAHWQNIDNLLENFRILYLAPLEKAQMGIKGSLLGNPNKPPVLMSEEEKGLFLPDEIKEILEVDFIVDIADLISVPLTLKGAKGVTFTPKYNFYMQEYEEAIYANSSMIEPLLPNLYVYGFRNQLKDKSSAEWLEKLMFLTPPEELVYDPNDQWSAANSPKLIAAKQSVEDFKEWAANFYNQQYKYMGIIQQKFTNIVIPAADIKLFNDLSEQANLFPMYIKIEFKTGKNTQIADTLIRAKLSKTFMEIVYNSTIPAEELTLSGENFRVWDITQWFDNVAKENTSQGSTVPDDTIILDTGSETSFQKNSLQKILSLMIFKSKISTLFGAILHEHSFMMAINSAYNNMTTAKEAYQDVLDYTADIAALSEKMAPLSGTDEFDKLYAKRQLILDLIDTMVGEGKKYASMHNWLLYLGGRYQNFSIAYSAAVDAAAKNAPYSSAIKNAAAKLAADLPPLLKQLSEAKEEYAKTGETVEGWWDTVALIKSLENEINEAQDALEKAVDALAGAKKAGTFTETVFYRIQKLDQSGTEIQNYYLPNSSDIDIMTFVDTQIRYNTSYQYALWKYDLLVKADSLAGGGGTAVLYERLVAGDLNVRVMDSPPMPPNVEFIPYRGINNKLLINLNPQAGSTKMEPVFLSDDEYTQIVEIATNQVAAGDIENGATIRFASDDPPASYEVYRITEPPFDHQDFSESLIERVSNPFSSFVDTIAPNTKYFYMFRTVDTHDHFSNPTAVYEIELVDNAGSIYPLIKTVELGIDMKIKLETQKTMKKYLLIKPSFLQSMPDASKIPEDTQEGTDIAPVFGLKPKSVFGGNYKIRLASKTTGKKIDINVSFEHKHTKT